MSWSSIAASAPARLDPGNDEARQWLQDELARSPYQDTRDPLQRALDALVNWLSDLIDGAQAPTDPLPTFVAGIVAVVLVALAAYALRFVRRTARRDGGGPEAVLGEERLTAEQFRERAARHLADGRYAACLLDALRAIASGAVERTLLEDAPSLTAHEIATRLTLAFPAHAQELRWAADRFDEVAYGDAEAGRAEAERLLVLDRSLASARPDRVAAGSRTPIGALP